MKRIFIIFTVIASVLTLAACSGSKTGSESSGTDKTVSGAASELFTVDGNDSEYDITESQAEELFKNSENKYNNESKAESVSQNSSSSEALAAESSKNSSTAAYVDADKDGWTDDWK